ncbi:MAG: peptidylprolyl isomerase [Gemmatirosa sp.]|nr:peptidylprolyl isomerase [Gemmatirosa sp.]
MRFLLHRGARVAAVIALATAAACARRSPLLKPDLRAERAVAPDTFVVRFETTRGRFDVQFLRSWAPRGADRVYYLVRSGYYDDVRFFRVLPGFVAQFGESGDPRVAKVWDTRTIRDDPVTQSNTRGIVTFATAGPNTRTTQLFVNFGNNARLDRLGFTPLGRVVDGMTRVVDSLYAGYGEGPPKGKGPDQDRMAAEGTRYLEKQFPKLDWIKSARVIHEGRRSTRKTR